MRTPGPASVATAASPGEMGSTSEEREAAEVLWSMVSGGSQTVGDTESPTKPEDCESEDPEGTLTMESEGEGETEGEVSEVALTQSGELRRNPPRVARPTRLAESE